MRTSGGLVLVCILSLGLAGAPLTAQEVDISGTWTLSMIGQSPTGENEATLTFELEDHDLLATMKNESGQVDCRGFLDGNRIRFYYIRPGKKEDFIAKFTGHVAGDLMGGEVDMGKRGLTTWLATRGPENGVDLSGSWTMMFQGDSPTGEPMASLRFRQERDHLIATIGSSAGEVDCDGFIDGREIRFYYLRADDKGGPLAKFTGRIAGEMMGGVIETGGPDKATWRATKNIE